MRHPIPSPHPGPLAQRRATLLAGLIVLLAACNPMTVGTLSTCPQVAILGGAEHLTRFAGEGRGVVDIAAEADVTSLTYTCKFNGERAETEIDIEFTVTRGVTSSVPGLDIPYFVAVADAAGNIIVKHPFSRPVTFGERSAGIARERITETIHLWEGVRPSQFQILVGFQLTPEELDFNEARHGG